MGDNVLLAHYAQPGESSIGEGIFLHGRVMDENAHPVPSTMVEIWQANAGRRCAAQFRNADLHETGLSGMRGPAGRLPPTEPIRT